MALTYAAQTHLFVRNSEGEIVGFYRYITTGWDGTINNMYLWPSASDFQAVKWYFVNRGVRMKSLYYVTDDTITNRFEVIVYPDIGQTTYAPWLEPVYLVGGAAKRHLMECDVPFCQEQEDYRVVNIIHSTAPSNGKVTTMVAYFEVI